MERALPTGGVLWRMLGAWADLRGSMRAELDRAPSEGRLLFFAMFAGWSGPEDLGMNPRGREDQYVRSRCKWQKLEGECDNAKPWEAIRTSLIMT